MLPTPQLNLHNLNAIRREMNTVYRQVRSGGLGAAEGRGLIWMLAQMGMVAKSALLENRMAEIERLLSDEQSRSQPRLLEIEEIEENEDE